MTLEEIQYKAQGIMQEWKYDDSAPYVEFVEELASMNIECPSEDLEDAFHQYLHKQDFKKIREWPFLSVWEAFEAGAQWQKEQDDELLTIAHLDGVASGRKKEREQMMKDAMEGEVCILPGGVAYVKEKNNGSLKQYILDNFKAGDKVKIIIARH